MFDMKSRQMKLVTVIIMLAVFQFSKAQPAADIMQYIGLHKQAAVEEMLRTGVPASIKLAQGIHETFAGKSVLVLKSNNHFGIKCKTGWSGKKVYHDDDERGECFRSYSSWVDSYKDHSDFLKNSQRYAFLFNLDPEDYKGWAHGLKKAGYATNVRYPQIIIRLIEDYNLQLYTLIALGKASPQDEILAGSQDPVKIVTAVNNVTGMTPPAEVVVIEEAAAPVNYPTGVFHINNTRVIYAPAGSSLLAVASEYKIPYSRLLDFNDMGDADVLTRGQLLYLQRKRKVGSSEFHEVKVGETLYDICQVEGIRFESLLSLNLLQGNDRPAAGQRLHLQNKAAEKPMLASAVSAPSTTEMVAAGPQRSLHVVQTKETLYSISRKYGVDVEKIREWNNLTGFDLRIGQELVILKN